MTDAPAPAAPRRPTSTKTELKLKQVQPDGTVAEKTFQMEYDFRAVAILEDLYEMPMEQIGAKLQNLKGLFVRDLQRLFYAGLKRHQPDVTLDSVMDILDSAMKAGEQTGDMMIKGFNAFDASAGSDAPPDPRAGAA